MSPLLRCKFLGALVDLRVALQSREALITVHGIGATVFKQVAEGRHSGLILDPTTDQHEAGTADHGGQVNQGVSTDWIDG